ncbi:hypothetical protein [Flagellimonas sp.]|uniref:hypothetical protein n=1 Tax=Flagellimonas sp. TaxID=2058762 RepID=UPI003B59AC9A
MKRITFLLSMALVFSLNSCGQDYKKLPNSKVDKSNVRIARDFATKYLEQSKKGETYTFNNEAIPMVKNYLTAENQKAVYESLKSQFGDFKDLEYEETWISPENEQIRTHRFKSTFEKSNKKLEVRVVLNEADKITGFWIRPWSDMFP